MRTRVIPLALVLVTALVLSCDRSPTEVQDDAVITLQTASAPVFDPAAADRDGDGGICMREGTGTAPTVYKEDIYPNKPWCGCPCNTPFVSASVEPTGERCYKKLVCEEKPTPEP